MAGIAELKSKGKRVFYVGTSVHPANRYNSATRGIQFYARTANMYRAENGLLDHFPHGQLTNRLFTSGAPEDEGYVYVLC